MGQPEFERGNNATIEELRVRLDEAEETIRAIQSGEVDALVVTGPEGSMVYTLKGAEYTYRILVETMREGAAILTPDGAVVYCNSRFAEIVKAPLERIIPQTMYCFIAPDDIPAFEELLESGRTGIHRREMSLVDIQGNYIPVLVSIGTMQMEDNKAISIVITDLTESKKVEEALRERERFIGSTLNSLTASIAIINEDGVIQYTNQAWRDFAAGNDYTGSPDMIGFNYLLTCDGAAGEDTEIAHAAATGIRDVLAGNKNEFALEYPCHSPEKQRWFIMRVTRFVDPGPVRAVIAHEDVTTRKLAEKEMERLVYSLGERTKELNCLYEVSSLAQVASLQPYEVLQKAVDLLPPAWQYPQITTARVQYDEFIYQTNGYRETPWMQSADIIIDNQIVGSVKVSYLEEKPQEYEGPFLQEERYLIDSVAQTIASIIERKTAEAELKMSEDKFARAFHSSPEMMTISTLTDGRYLDVNRSFVDVIGFGREEVIGRTASDLGVWVDISDRDRLIRTLQTGQPVRNWELSFYTKAGSIVDTLVSAEIIELTGERCLLTIVTDITKRKQAERALQESEQLQRQVLEALPVGVWFVDREGRILTSNKAAFDIWGGAEYVDIEGYGVYKGWWLDTGEPIEANEWAVVRAINYGEVYINQEVEIETFGGIRKIISNSAIPLRDHTGDISGAIVVNEDITERIQAEREKEKARLALEEVYKRERRIAETLQRNFLPDKILDIEGYNLADAYQPALKEAAIGGDVYDIFKLPNGKYAIAIADVSGKGLKAARYGAMVKYMLRAYSYRVDDPGEVLAMLNDSVTIDMDLEVFVTCFYGILDPEKHLFTYANAGHEEPLLVPQKQRLTQRLDVTGSALGIQHGMTYGTSSLKLQHGDILFFYTDGVTDARGVEPRIGIEGLEQYLAARCGLSAHDIIECMLTEVKRRSGNQLADDVAMLALEVCG